MSTDARDVAADMDDLELSQFKDSPRFKETLGAVAGVIQSTEDDVCFLVEDALLSNATAAYLDRYGKLLLIDRDGRTDNEYRRLIETRIAANNSSGTIPAILAVVSILGDDAQVIYSPLYPACFQLQVLTTSPLTAAQLADIDATMHELAPAGVCWLVTEAGTTTPKTFDKAGLGFDEGKFGRVISQSP